MTLLSPPPTATATPPDHRDPEVRLAALLDPGSVEELPADPTVGMRAATGTVDGTPCVVFCADPRVMGGALGEEGCEVVVRAYERAIEDSVPIVGIWHSGGARLAEGVASLHGVGRIFAAMTRAS